jgi:hypothetical protein
MKIELEDYNGNTIMVVDFKDEIPNDEIRFQKTIALASANGFDLADEEDYNWFRFQDIHKKTYLINTRIAEMLRSFTHLYVSKEFRTYN